MLTRIKIISSNIRSFSAYGLFISRTSERSKPDLAFIKHVHNLALQLLIEKNNKISGLQCKNFKAYLDFLGLELKIHCRASFLKES